ncbi:hypothetical protein C450_18604 [Halococcus salifodinae DSM 8989]|uniref:Uncharacterized protein n=1 Tax=Halococcus salifodinae DSM 8989 TaxID=1227456 RepID=M0MUQ7_9EURY|nr:hypothetical protein C450_18604 [Halococcus salifodinae DSM 8989]
MTAAEPMEPRDRSVPSIPNKLDRTDNLTEGMIYYTVEYTEACTPTWGDASGNRTWMSPGTMASSFYGETEPLRAGSARSCRLILPSLGRVQASAEPLRTPRQHLDDLGLIEP